ncbi:MAG: hypothetical protein L0216_19835 [Planctomycetales bacterium]|nr:hypothetical protein [Planctomycetales bacterium]
MGLDKDLLDILACPHCLTPVREDGEKLVCTRPECGLRYAVEDGIPNMLIDDADKTCPKCGKARAYDGRVLSCPGCGGKVEDPRLAARSA